MNILTRFLNLWHHYFILSPFSWNVIITFFTTTCVILLIAAFFKKLKWTQAIGMMFLVNYLFLICISTVLSRLPYWNFFETIANKPYYTNFIPLHSYVKIFAGNKNYILEVLFNIFMLFPAGILLPIVKKKATFKTIMIFALVFTLSIEMIQLVCKCGTCETDDIIHNVLGCLLGFLLFKKVQKFVEEYKKKQEAQNEVD